MKSKQRTIGKSLAIGFGLVLMLVSAVGILSYSSIGRIMSDARTVTQTDGYESAQAQNALLQSAKTTQRRILWVVGFALVLGGVIAFFMARSIVEALGRMTIMLDEGAEQVATASEQVSSSSQSLSSGASQQAASIEETSSALEQMSSMTKQNADNAKTADQLMKSANAVVISANQSMEALTRSMTDISTASEETSKIIKTIDEIAFQTNLLALNAAVEAARAGEAGAGFAVVADEVRNLAMRAADAARDTAHLIEGTVSKVSEGTTIVRSTDTAFSQVSESAHKVAELVAEIAAASHEQSMGIEQINRAVMDMDKVTQQNAANAEESASASEQMNAQASQMKSIVSDLTQLVGGTGNGLPAAGAMQIIERFLPKMEKRGPAAAPAAVTVGNATGRRPRPVQKLSPEQVIPLDEDDFKGF